MNFDFAAVLVIAAVVTGSIWMLDSWVLAPRRLRAGKTSDYPKNAGRVADSDSKPAAVALSEAARKEQKLPWYVDFSRSFFPVIVAVLVLRSFVIEPFRIPSSSMEPTLLPGDFILVSKFSYGIRLPVIHTKIVDLGEPERGDVAVFRYPNDPSVAFIKRIVGLPGDSIEYRNKQLFINDEPAPQLPVGRNAENRYYEQRFEQLGNAGHLIQVDTQQASRSNLWPDLQWERLPDGDIAWRYQVPTGHYFAMGDNRDNSSDSRFWGPLPQENLIGEAFMIWMNWDCVRFKGHCNRIGSSIE